MQIGFSILVLSLNSKQEDKTVNLRFKYKILQLGLNHSGNLYKNRLNSY